MTCPHLEDTSALFDGRPIDRAHADSCEECRAFLADAASLREAMRDVTFATAPRTRIARILVPATLMLCLALFLFFRNDATEEAGPFAGLDGGGRAVITVKDAR